MLRLGIQYGFRGFFFDNCQRLHAALYHRQNGSLPTLAPISASQNHILGASHSAYSARRGSGNCRHGAGRCSAAQTESLAPCKIGPRNLLVLKRSDFAAMEKVRENARISLFSASFYCGKEAKTLAKAGFRAVFSLGRMCFPTSCAVPTESILTYA